MSDATQSDTVLRFSGAQTIAGIEDARKRLLDSLDPSATTLCIDCHDLEACDLSFVQVLIAAQRSAAARGLALRLIGAPALTATCAAAGIDLADLTGPEGDPR